MKITICFAVSPDLRFRDPETTIFFSPKLTTLVSPSFTSVLTVSRPPNPLRPPPPVPPSSSSSPPKAGRLATR